MDNARWLVVLSVIFCMAVTLTLLNRYAGGSRQPGPVIDEKKEQITRTPADRSSQPQENRQSRRKAPRFTEVSFPRPAAHTFVVESPQEIDRMNADMKVEGKLIR